MLTETKTNYISFVIDVINKLRTEYTCLNSVPSHFLSSLFNFPSYQVYQIILEINVSMRKYIKSVEIDDYNIVAAYYIGSENNIVRKDIYSIERILKSESKLKKFDYDFSKHATDILFLCRFKNHDKAFIVKRIYWSHIEQIFGKYLVNSLETLVNINNALKTLFDDYKALSHFNRYLLTTYSDKSILTKLTLKAKFSKTIEDEVVYKYTLYKKYEDAKIRNYKPKIYKLFRKVSEIADKKLIPTRKDEEITVFSVEHISNINDIFNTVIMYDLLENINMF